MKKCPFCAESIQDEAIICRYCGRDIDKQKTKQDKKNTLKYQKLINTEEDFEDLYIKLLENPYIYPNGTKDEFFKFTFGISSERIDPIFNILIKGIGFNLPRASIINEDVVSSAIKMGKLCYSIGIEKEKGILDEDELNYFIIFFASVYAQIYLRNVSLLIESIPNNQVVQNRLSELLTRDQEMIFIAATNLVIMGRRDFYENVKSKFEFVGKSLFEMRLIEICKNLARQ